MNWWTFFLYRCGKFLKKVCQIVSKEKTYSSEYYEFTTGWSLFALVYSGKTYDSKAHIQIYFI